MRGHSPMPSLATCRPRHQERSSRGDHLRTGIGHDKDTFNVNRQMIPDGQANVRIVEMTSARELAIPISHEQVADFCRRWRIRRLSFFGSVVRDDFGSDSDVDVLVEFRPESRISWNIVTAEQELSEIVGRRVDLRTPPELSRWMIKDVLREAVAEYVEED